MNVTTELMTKLPPLAWIAAIDRRNDVALILHGRWVEVSDCFIVEGVWDDPFRSGNFADTPNFFGSGAIFGSGSILFVSSSATTDYIFYKTNSEHVFVSNSLPGLLAWIGDELDPCVTSYWDDCESICLGIDSYNNEIKTRKGSVKRLIHRNLLIDAQQVLIVDKPMPLRFQGYDDYVTFFKSGYERISLNARDTARSFPLHIFSTQSKGYDSTAVNSIAAPFGLDGSFTISESKVSGRFAELERSSGIDDDGSEISAIFGVRSILISRRSFAAGLPNEYLYFSGIANSEDLNFAQIVDRVTRPSMLLTGTFGEIYYPRFYYETRFPGAPLDGDLRRGDLGCHGLSEVRLAAGIIHAPIIFMGAQHRKDIQSITEGKEMEPWRIRASSYDRPIPRRISEEAGVPRSLFGQIKLATVVSFSRPNIPHEPLLKQQFFDFLDRNGLLRKCFHPLFSLVHRLNSLVWFSSPARYRVVYYLGRAWKRFFGCNLPLIWQKLNSSLFCFSVNKRVDDYHEFFCSFDKPSWRPDSLR